MSIQYPGHLPVVDQSTPPGYAELHTFSCFTFLQGASHPEELVARARALGYTALALTDECSLAGAVRAHLAAREAGLALIHGTTVALETGGAGPSPGGGASRLVLLATDRVGWGQVSALVTRGRRAAEKGTYRLTHADLDAAALDHCLALLVPAEDAASKTREHQARWLAERFPGRGWLGVELLRGADDAGWLAMLEHAGDRAGLPRVAVGGARMHARGRRALHDLLGAIRIGCTVAEAGRRLAPSGERHLRSRAALAHLYPATLLAETLVVAERCRFSLDALRYEYPRELVPAGTTATEHLRALTEAGMRARWPDGAPSRVRTLIEHELALIAELGYEAYFLTVHDLVRFARERGILCQGRGSAANSAVCFCLGITEVDPARMEMLFERFISRERNEPPDIDVDFEHERREEVIQYIYRKYGRDRAALAATVITYRPRSAVRDVGKALGLSLAQVDRLARSMAWWDRGQVLDERLRELGFDPRNPVMRRLVVLVETLVGFPRHLSQHTGGFVIARDALHALVPIENAAMAERTVIQWDKDDLDALGLLKVDVLALGMLTAIRKALDLVAEHRGRRLTMAEVPAEDPDVYRMIQRADTVGVFQIESRAQMAMLPRMRPRTFYDLVIEVAIVRPGPIQGGMVHPYLRRRAGTEPVTYPSEAVRGVLERTLGVPIFQEQVMQLAVVAAGFTPGEADGLRRAMAAWRRRGSLGPFEERLIGGMRDRGYGEDFARRIFEQIKGFGEYGFPESHAASFALLVYVSAWLKCHEPAVFVCAMLNSQPLGFYAPAQLVRDAREHGVEVRPVDVTSSDWDCTLEPVDGGALALRLGLRMVKGLAQASGTRIVAARVASSEGGSTLVDVQDLARRAGLDRGDLARLADAGALAALAGHRHRAWWSVAGVEAPSPLLEAPRFAEGDPLLRRPTEGQDLVADYRALGLSLGRHPLALLRSALARRRLIPARELNARGHGSFARTAGVVINRQRPESASGVIFMTLEDETGHVNLVLWPWVVERQRREVLGARLLAVHGTVQREGEVVHLVAGRLDDLTHLLGALETRSRDFG
ncbi:MAG: error-prone DNA polymerase [Ectothiorhodospiraceae bacterium]|nr:error-prone DNA polymerase [Ectothiorhodospiraceae bacterium]